jgi:hypothetical protein
LILGDIAHGPFVKEIYHPILNVPDIETFSRRASDMIIQTTHPKFRKAIPNHTYAMDHTQPDQVVQQIFPVAWALED